MKHYDQLLKSWFGVIKMIQLYLSKQNSLFIFSYNKELLNIENILKIHFFLLLIIFNVKNYFYYLLKNHNFYAYNLYKVLHFYRLQKCGKKSKGYIVLFLFSASSWRKTCFCFSWNSWLKIVVVMLQSSFYKHWISYLKILEVRLLYVSICIGFELPWI